MCWIVIFPDCVWCFGPERGHLRARAAIEQQAQLESQRGALLRLRSANLRPPTPTLSDFIQCESPVWPILSVHSVPFTCSPPSLL